MSFQDEIDSNLFTTPARPRPYSNTRPSQKEQIARMNSHRGTPWARVTGSLPFVTTAPEAAAAAAATTTTSAAVSAPPARPASRPESVTVASAAVAAAVVDWNEVAADLYLDDSLGMDVESQPVSQPPPPLSSQPAQALLRHPAPAAVVNASQRPAASPTSLPPPSTAAPASVLVPSTLPPAHRAASQSHATASADFAGIGIGPATNTVVPATSEAELYRKQVAELEQMLLGANEVARSRYDQLQKDFERAKEELTRLNQAPAAPPPAKLKKLEEKIREQQDTIEMKDKQYLELQQKFEEAKAAAARKPDAARPSSDDGLERGAKRRRTSSSDFLLLPPQPTVLCEPAVQQMLADVLAALRGVLPGELQRELPTMMTSLITIDPLDVFSLLPLLTRVFAAHADPNFFQPLLPALRLLNCMLKYFPDFRRIVLSPMATASSSRGEADAGQGARASRALPLPCSTLAPAIQQQTTEMLTLVLTLLPWALSQLKRPGMVEMAHTLLSICDDISENCSHSCLEWMVSSTLGLPGLFRPCFYPREPQLEGLAMRLLARAVRVRPGLQVFGADSPEFCFVKALWSEPAAANIVDLLAATAASLPRPEMLLHCSSADCSCPQNTAVYLVFLLDRHLQELEADIASNALTKLIALPAPFFNVKRGVSLWLMLSGAASFTRVITEHPALRHRAVSTVLRTLLVFTSLKQMVASSGASPTLLHSIDLCLEEAQELHDDMAALHRSKDEFSQEDSQMVASARHLGSARHELA